MWYYAESIEQGFHGNEPENIRVAAEIRKYYYKDPGQEQQEHKQAAQRYVRNAKGWILPVPDDVKINPEFLGELDNDEFVSAFRDLRHLAAAMYDDIHNAPFDWGYPDKSVSDEYRNRVNDILFALVQNGACHNGVITVDAKAFFASTPVKRHKKVELMIKVFTQFGFVFAGYGKKAEKFRVSHMDNPNMVTVLCAYVHADKRGASDKALNGFSYRFLQDPATQKYPALWNQQMDYASDKLREIQAWLFDEAVKHGFIVAGMNKGCISYKKGSKEFLLVRQGHRPPGANDFEHHESKIGTKVSFIHAFEHAPDKMRVLCGRFPDVFRLYDPGRCCGDKEISPDQFAGRSEETGKRCAFVMKFNFDGIAYKRCGLANFFFEDINLDDVKIILEMYKIENKIKQNENGKPQKQRPVTQTMTCIGEKAC
jgi:hypothetical protein